jgi:hypothetical protein
MAAAKPGPKIMTANRLRDGRIVYLGAVGWSERFTDASVAETPEQEAAFEARAQADVKARIVVGAYLAPMANDADGPRPLTQRERIRAAGPSVRPAGYTEPKSVHASTGSARTDLKTARPELVEGRAVFEARNV